MIRIVEKVRAVFTQRKNRNATLFIFNFVYVFMIFATLSFPVTRNLVLSPLPFSWQHLSPLSETKSSKEIFGFAPYWTFEKLDNVDFSVLTTLAYFAVSIDGNGRIDRQGRGYDVFQSQKATEVFKKAHDNGTRVVLTITQMDNDIIEQFMDNEKGQEKGIEEIVSEVKERGIDGINVDFEYIGDPGQEYRDKFTKFVANLSYRMHEEVPNSKVTVSVYASAVKDPKIYDIAALSQNSDGIFMMAYDFAVASSNNAIPTAPLYGHKEGKYWYDIATAVEDFLAYMPSDKLILGLPWYGYNYPVDTPEVKAERNKGYYTAYRRGKRTYYSFVALKAQAQTYAIVQNDITPQMEGIDEFQDGWDEKGQVGFKAYHLTSSDTWRIVFYDDERSLGIKYDFAKEKNLGGVGMWALGFDDGKTEMWDLLRAKFGTKLADAQGYANR